MTEAEFHFNCINRSKVCREIMRLDSERQKIKSELSEQDYIKPKWSERDLYNQLIGQLQDLIY